MPTSSIKSINSNKYTICDRDIETYYYSINKNKRLLKKTTPYKIHIMDTELFEGEYHPLCKVPDYPSINITETKIMDGNKVIFNAKTLKGLENINVNLHIALIACQYHSLYKRLKYDFNVMNAKVDINHIRGAYFTIDIINKNLNVLRNNINSAEFKCILTDLIKNFGNLSKIENIYIKIEHNFKVNIDYKDYLRDIQNQMEPLKKKLFF